MRVRNLVIILCITISLVISISCISSAAGNVSPTITLSPAPGSTISATDSIVIEASDPDDKVTKIEYKWETDAALITVRDTTIAVKPPVTLGLHTLYIKATDRNGAYSENTENYNIAAPDVQAERVSVVMSPDTGIVALAGKGGLVKLFNTQGHYIRDTKWQFVDITNNEKNIYGGGSFKNGDRIFVGENGQYCITDATSNPDPVNVRSGIWTTGGYNPSISVVTSIYNSSPTPGFSENEMIMIGSNGEWQVINDNGVLSTTQNGIPTYSDLEGVRAADGMQDGSVVMAGKEGKIKIINSNRTSSPDEAEHWKTGGTDDSSEIYAVLSLDSLNQINDNSVLFAGQGGKIQIRSVNSGVVTWHTPQTWGHSGVDITSLSILPNGNILAAGTNGYFQVMKVAKTSDHAATFYTDSEHMGCYNTLSGTVSAGPFMNGRIMLVGKNSGFESYKLHKYDALEVISTTETSVKLRTVFDKEGFDNAILDMSADGGATWVEKIPSFTGSEVEVTGLTSGIQYIFKVRRLMHYPIYYHGDESEGGSVIPIPVSISDFTDRVTAANSWVGNDENAIKKYNRYMRESEVVCRIDLEPANKDMANYHITFNANTDNSNYNIEYIKIVRMVIGEGDTKEVQPISTVHNINLKTIDFDTSSVFDTGDKNVSVYVKYRFKKKSGVGALPVEQRQFTNKVTIVATEDNLTHTESTIDKTNIIYVMDAKGEIR